MSRSIRLRCRRPRRTAGSSRTGCGCRICRGRGGARRDWARAADGSATLDLSKPFTQGLAGRAGSCARSAGADGPLRDVRVTRETVVLDGLLGDGDRRPEESEDGCPVGPAVGAAADGSARRREHDRPAAARTIRQAFALHVVVRLPGSRTTVSAAVPTRRSTRRRASRRRPRSCSSPSRPAWCSWRRSSDRRRTSSSTPPGDGVRERR